MSIEEKIKNAKEDSWLKDSVSEEEFKKIKESVKTDGDCISRKAVLELYDKYHYSLATKVYEFGEELKKLPTIPQTYSSVIAKIKMWSESPEYSYGERNVMKVILQELEDTIPQTDYESHEEFGWCKGCKEYDTEKHCCHRYSSFIRETLQENINAVLDGIKAEISQINTNYCGGYWGLSKQEVIDIIDKHISRKE